MPTRREQLEKWERIRTRRRRCVRPPLRRCCLGRIVRTVFSAGVHRRDGAAQSRRSCLCDCDSARANRWRDLGISDVVCGRAKVQVAETERAGTDAPRRHRLTKTVNPAFGQGAFRARALLRRRRGAAGRVSRRSNWPRLSCAWTAPDAACTPARLRQGSPRRRGGNLLLRLRSQTGFSRPRPALVGRTHERRPDQDNRLVRSNRSAPRRWMMIQSP